MKPQIFIPNRIRNPLKLHNNNAEMQKQFAEDICTRPCVIKRRKSQNLVPTRQWNDEKNKPKVDERR